MKPRILFTNMLYLEQTGQTDWPTLARYLSDDETARVKPEHARQGKRDRPKTTTPKKLHVVYLKYFANTPQTPLITYPRVTKLYVHNCRVEKLGHVPGAPNTTHTNEAAYHMVHPVARCLPKTLYLEAP